MTKSTSTGLVAANKDNLFEFAKMIYRVAGKRTSALFLACIPIGLILGSFEVVAAFVLYLVLVRFNLLAPSTSPLWIATVWDPIALLAVAVVVVAVLRYVAQLLPSAANSTFESRLRQALARATLNSPGEEGRYSVAEASHLLNTVIPKSGVFLQGVIAAIGTACILLLVGVALVRISFALSMFAFAAAAVIGLPIVFLKRFCARRSDRAYEYYRSFNYRFIKDVRNASFLKISGLDEYESGELSKLSDRARHNSHAYQSLFAIGSNLPFVGAAVMIVALLILNEHFKILPAAQLVPFIYLLNRTAGSFGALSAGTGTIREMMPYALELVRHAQALGTPATSANGGQTSTATSLEAQGLLFGRKQPLTSSLNFSVKSGEMLLISGPSGKGKTTLLLTLLGLVPKLSGQIVWGGIASEKIDWIGFRRKVGYAGPEPFLIDADIRTNLLFGLHQTVVGEAALDRALRISCAEFVYDLPGGLAYELREHGDGISAGQKQRLALARCLLRQPSVLVLDEATANLDEATEKQFFERLSDLSPDLIVVAVSHRSSLRKYATQFVEL